MHGKPKRHRPPHQVSAAMISAGERQRWQMCGWIAAAVELDFGEGGCSHLLSMSWTELTLDGSSFVPSVRVLARKTGLNSANGSRSVCHVPSSVSKLRQKAMPSQLASVRRMHLQWRSSQMGRIPPSSRGTCQKY